MLKPLFLLITLLVCLQSIHAQKKYINRKVAQKNYDGYMLMQEKKYNEALDLFDDAINDDADAFFIYQNRAICKLYLKDTLGAISDYQTNIKLEPANTESKYALGNIYKYRKDSVNALKYFVPAIKQANEEFSQNKLLYMNNFAGHYFRLHEDYDSALVFYKQVKIFTPNNSSVYINSAVCNFHLDSMEQFCNDLEKAFIHGGDVNCTALKSFCKGCNHLLAERGNTDTLSRALDTRLDGIIPDTIYLSAGPSPFKASVDIRKVKVYFNKRWQICAPERASYYREAFWSAHQNFFGGQFTDYYINGNVYATGRIENRKLRGAYRSYYQNGKTRIKGHFIEGIPCKKWTCFLEDGNPDYEIEFMLDDFNLRILNKTNPCFAINSGTGKFEIVLDQWEHFDFVISGEYLNNHREGSWVYKQNGRKLIWEKYKKGKFRSGYVATNMGNKSFTNSRFDALIFIPPQITQVAGLYFDSLEAVTHYPFIKILGP